MLSCKKSAELMSQGMDRSLSRQERFVLRLHLLMCRGCRNVWRQMEFIRRACQTWLTRDG